MRTNEGQRMEYEYESSEEREREENRRLREENAELRAQLADEKVRTHQQIQELQRNVSSLEAENNKEWVLHNKVFPRIVAEYKAKVEAQNAGALKCCLLKAMYKMMMMRESFYIDTPAYTTEVVAEYNRNGGWREPIPVVQKLLTASGQIELVLLHQLGDYLDTFATDNELTDETFAVVPGLRYKNGMYPLPLIIDNSVEHRFERPMTDEDWKW